MSDISLIAALDHNHAIGREGAMPWHLPDDLKRFKALTLGKPVLMGRKTAESIGRPLPGRTNLVLSLGKRLPFSGENVRQVHSIDEARAHAGDTELMVIGGGEVYRQTLEFASRLYLTIVDTVASDVDTYFPSFDFANAWTETARTHHGADSRHEYAFDFVDYERTAASS
ncbi:MAG: dihydrofolate reductase [Proteobacteria bacterium]|nr:dihydrofolate reductase [Pseudomonadota bacterium]